jgi:hypothetical protein
MSNIILSTAATDNYMVKIIPYLNSIEQYSNFDKNIFISLGHDYNGPHFSKIETLSMSFDDVLTKNQNNGLQHGDFLYCKIFDTINENDYICFTDGDIIMQRSMLDAEKDMILSLKDNEVLVQYNANKNDSLYSESHRIKPQINIDTFFDKYLCFNTGVIICNKKTYQYLEHMYRVIHPIVRNIFHHYAAQQWTLSYIINSFMKPIILDYSFHMHHHYGHVEGESYKDNKIYYNDTLVLFAHHITGISG